MASGAKKRKTPPNNGAKKKSWLRRNLLTIVLLLLMVVGAGLLLYPTISDYWNSLHATRVVNNYFEEAAQLSNEEYDRILNSAKDYNRNLAKKGTFDLLSSKALSEYEKVLSITRTGVMGTIEIPKISVSLPIYHGTSNEVLNAAIGHLEWSSLPVGAASFNYEEMVVADPSDGAHCVLSGHRGLPSARLFTDLDQLVEGDTFALVILGETYTYEVDQIRVVEPSDFSELRFIPGEDLCTLVTCTPYGINSHRLLVRGHRTTNVNLTNIRVIADAIQLDVIYVAPVIALAIIILLVILFFILTSGRTDKERAVQARRLSRNMRLVRNLDLSAMPQTDAARSRKSAGEKKKQPAVPPGRKIWRNKADLEKLHHNGPEEG